MNQLFAADTSHDSWLFTFVLQAPVWLRLITSFALGAITGRGLVNWFPRMDLPENVWTLGADEGRFRMVAQIPLLGFWFAPTVSPRAAVRRRAALAVEIATGLLFAGLMFTVVDLRCQETPEEGSGFLIHWRILFQFILLALLVAATVVDLEMYLIPDAITVTGMILGMALAAAVGNLQLVPLWVDWNQAVPGLAGPYIPDWIRVHNHWHGLAWSAAGLAVGAGLTWSVRFVASAVMGREALGFGDVTLMGMIGSFIGWQAVVFVFLLAPLCGLVVGLSVRMITGRTYVPYGPYLSLAAVVVLYTWKWLWTPTHAIFGDAMTLGILAAVAFAALVVLLGLSRLYWMIPVTGRKEDASHAPEADEEPATNE